MSLINTMLKDLEKRETPQEKFPYVTITNTPQKTKIFSQSVIALVLFISLAAFSAFLFMHFFLPKKSLLLPPLSDQPVQASITEKNNSDADWLKVITINGVSLQIKDNITELTFSLNHPALYRLVSNETRNQISLIIDHANLQSALPAMEYLNTAIEKITSENLNGDTKFIFNLIPGATLKYVNLNKANETAELVVAIEYQAINRGTQENQTDKHIKTPAMHDVLIKQYQSALLLAENGNYASAIDHLTSLLKIDPNYKDARVSLAALLIDQGSSFKAKKLVEEGLNENPEYIPFVELKARLLATEGKAKEALAILQTVSPPIDENPDYHAFIAALYEQNNHFSLAANLYKQLLNLNPSNGNWWFGLGVSLDKLGKNKQAISAYNRAALEGHLNRDSLAYLQNRLQKLQEAIDVKE